MFPFKPVKPPMHAQSVTQSCLAFCDPVDCSPLSASVHGIFQVRIVEWVAISSSPGHLPEPEIKPASLALAGGFFTTQPPGKPTSFHIHWINHSHVQNVYHLVRTSHPKKLIGRCGTLKSAGIWPLNQGQRWLLFLLRKRMLLLHRQRKITSNIFKTNQILNRVTTVMSWLQSKKPFSSGSWLIITPLYVFS